MYTYSYPSCTFDDKERSHDANAEITSLRKKNKSLQMKLYRWKKRVQILRKKHGNFVGEKLHGIVKPGPTVCVLCY